MALEIIQEENKDKKEEEVIELYKEEIPTRSFNDIIKQENVIRLSDITNNLGNITKGTITNVNITVESGDFNCSITNKQILFSDNGVVAGDAKLTWDKGSETLFVRDTISAVSGLPLQLKTIDHAIYLQPHGDINARCEDSTNSAGSWIVLNAGDVGSGDFEGGWIDILAGDGFGTGDGGCIEIYSGRKGATGADGNIYISSNAGSIYIKSAKLGFFDITPVVKPTALTAQLTDITYTAPGTPDYALQDLVQNTGFGFVTKDEGNTALSVIKNLQTRVSELETKLKSLGLLT